MILGICSEMNNFFMFYVLTFSHRRDKSFETSITFQRSQFLFETNFTAIKSDSDIKSLSG